MIPPPPSPDEASSIGDPLSISVPSGTACNAENANPQTDAVQTEMDVILPMVLSLYIV